MIDILVAAEIYIYLSRFYLKYFEFCSILTYFSGATATCGPWPDRESGSNVTCHLLHFANLLFPAPEDLIRRHLSIAILGDPLLFVFLDHFIITLRGLCFYPCVLNAPPTSTVGLSPLPLYLVRQNH